MKVIRVSDKAYEFFTEWARRNNRSVCKQMDIAAQYSEQYEKNREKEDYIKSLAMQSLLETEKQLERKKTEQSMDKFMKSLQKQQASAPVLTNEQMGITNNYPPDTYEWYMEEALTRELTNEEIMRANELSLIKEGWDPEAAHKKIYC